MRGSRHSGIRSSGKAEWLEHAAPRIPTPADFRTEHIVLIEENIASVLSAVKKGTFLLEHEVLQNSRRQALNSLKFLLEHGGFSPVQNKLCHRMIGILEKKFTAEGMAEFLSLSCGLKGKTI